MLRGGPPRILLRILSGWRRFSLGVATAATLLVGAAPAQASPFPYVTNLFGDNVSQYKIGWYGLLAPLSPPTVAAGRSPAGLTVSPNGKSLYVTNTGPFDNGAAASNGGAAGDSVSQYTIRASGRLLPKSPPTVAAGDGPVAVAVRPDGESAYVVNESGDSVSQYNVGWRGKLSPKRPRRVAAGSEPTDVAVSPDGKSVYVTNAGAASVSQYDVGPGGRLSPKSPRTVAAGDIPIDLAVNPDGKSVYVIDHGVISGGGNSAGVLQFNVGSGGELSPKSRPRVRAGTNPISVAVSANGKSVYVTNDGSVFGGGRDSVFQYDVGPNGALSFKSPRRANTGKYPFGVAVSPNGRSVYVVNLGNSSRHGSVSQYHVGPGGKLSPKSPPKVAAGDSPEWVAVSPPPTTRHQCKHGGWKRFGFRNRARCIRFVKHGSTG